MKNFSFKLLQQLNQKKADKGFTLIELLVVIIIIGILSAIALPAFLNQANKARQSEAKQAIGAINRGQQAYYLERQLFSRNINGLGLGVAIDTDNYSYGAPGTIATPAANAKYTFAADEVGITMGYEAGTRNTLPGWDSYAVTFAVSKNQEAVRDYFGITYLIPSTDSSEATTLAALCEEQDTADGTMSFANTNGELDGTVDGKGIDTAPGANCGTNALPVAQ